jgi:hypothetical protein
MSAQIFDGVEVKKELKHRLTEAIWEEAAEWMNCSGGYDLAEHHDKVVNGDSDLAEAVTVAAREDSAEAFSREVSVYGHCSVDQTAATFYETLSKEAVTVLRRARSRDEEFLRITKAEEAEHNKDGEWLRQARSALAHYLEGRC